MFNIHKMELDQKRYEIALEGYLKSEELKNKLFIHGLNNEKEKEFRGVNLWEALDADISDYKDEETLKDSVDGFNESVYSDHPDAWELPCSLYIWDSFKEVCRHADEYLGWILIQSGITDIGIRYRCIINKIDNDKFWSLWLCVSSPRGNWKFKLQQNIKELPHNWSYPEVIIEVIGIANFVLDQYGKNRRAFRTDKHESGIDRISLIERDAVSKLSKKNSTMYYKIPDNFRSRCTIPTFLN